MNTELLLTCVFLTLVVGDYQPRPTYIPHDGYGEFTLTDEPGISKVTFSHQPGFKDVIFNNDALKGVDGMWRVRIDEHQTSTKIMYWVSVVMNGATYTNTPYTWIKDKLPSLPGRRTRGAVIFRDDFNGNHVDTKHWRVEVSATGDWHNEFQIYTNDKNNVYVKNGHLYLRPTLTVDHPGFTEQQLHSGVMDLKKVFGICTNKGFNGCYRDASKMGQLLPPIMSGRIESLVSYKFGVLEIRAKMPRGDWLWPAMWTLPTHSSYGGSSVSWAEVDLLEATSNEFFRCKTGSHCKNAGANRITSNFHFGPRAQSHPLPTERGMDHGDYHQDFHTWRLEWNTDHLILYVDNQVMNRLDVPSGTTIFKKYGFHGPNIYSHGSKIAPFDDPMFLILNNAVGGTAGIFPDKDLYAYPKPWGNHAKDPLGEFWSNRHNWLPTWKGEDTALVIDYVEFRHL
ncbi:hypothetical protein SNE40_001953 [Patella caerulea]|uniref:GH16 domain-containing protein n=1 Tax=Patella caerulea TaxID=87958 RepID=A0AAN8K551_PATCE